MTNENYTRWRGVMRRAYKIIRPDAEGTPATLDTITLIDTIEMLCDVLEKQKREDDGTQRGIMNKLTEEAP